MATVNEHNFGFWEIDGQVERAFFEYVQRQSVQFYPGAPPGPPCNRGRDSATAGPFAIEGMR
jgi:hypothetical protein